MKRLFKLKSDSSVLLQTKIEQKDIIRTTCIYVWKQTQQEANVPENIYINIYTHKQRRYDQKEREPVFAVKKEGKR